MNTGQCFGDAGAETKSAARQTEAILQPLGQD
jgi:hypothetical protein